MLMPDVPTTANGIRVYLIPYTSLELDCGEGAVEAKCPTECLNMVGCGGFGVGVEDHKCWITQACTDSSAALSGFVPASQAIVRLCSKLWE